MTRSLLLIFSTCFLGCATVPKGDIELLKPTIEAFHQAARWKDFQAIGELVVPEKKDAFIAARRAMKDDKDLFISDYELEDARVSLDMLKASAVSHIKWYRLPSVSEEDSTVVSNWVWKNKAWRLDSQNGGPFASELKL